MSKTKKSSKKAIVKAKKAAKVNPFTLHHNRTKFDILGQKKKTGGTVTASRSRANDVRKSTLLVEYVNRHRNNVFIDRRLDSVEDRRIRQMKALVNKKSLYNLSEDPETNPDGSQFLGLTHGGEAITDDTQFRRDFSDDEDYGRGGIEDDLLKEDGMLDAKFVERQHFGGGDQDPSEDGTVKKPQLSAKDREMEIIASSKQRRMEEKKQKEKQYNDTKSLDSQFKNIMQLMKGNVITRDDIEKGDAERKKDSFHSTILKLRGDTSNFGPATERTKSQEEIQKEARDKEAKEEELRKQRMIPDYLKEDTSDKKKEGTLSKKDEKSIDTLDKFTMAAASAAPNESLSYRDGRRVLLAGEDLVNDQTRNKLSKEDKKKIKKQRRVEKEMELEDQRLMEEIGMEIESETNNDAGEEDSMNDADNDNSMEVDNSSAEDSESGDDNEEDEYSDILSEEEEKEVGEDDADEILMLKNLLDDKQLKINTEDTNVEYKKDRKKKAKKERKEAKLLKEIEAKDFFCEETILLTPSKTKKKRVSFTIPGEDTSEENSSKNELQQTQPQQFSTEVPEDVSSLLQMASSCCRNQNSSCALFDRLSAIVAANSPDRKHSNILKCGKLFALVLKLVEELINRSIGNNKKKIKLLKRHIEVIGEILHSLALLVPEDAAREFLLVFIRKRDEYRSKKRRTYPGFDTLMYLRIAGRLFPASDFYHPVMTPVKSFLRQLLTEAVIRTPTNVLAALWTASLLTEYEAELGRYNSELLMTLQGLLLRCCPVEAVNLAAHNQQLQRKHMLETAARSTQNATNTSGTDGTQSINAVKSSVEIKNHCSGPTCVIPLSWLRSPVLPHHDLIVLTDDCSQWDITTKDLTIDITLFLDPVLVLNDLLKCTVLSVLLKLISRNAEEQFKKQPTVILTALTPTSEELLRVLPTQLLPPQVKQQASNLQKLLDDLYLQKKQQPLQRLRVDRGRPKALRMFEPDVYEMRLGVPTSHFNKSDSAIKKLKLEASIKKERKGARREMTKDTKYLAKQKLKEGLASDAERKKKVKIIMSGLQQQQGEHNTYNKIKMSRK